MVGASLMLGHIFDAFAIYISCVLAIIPTLHIGAALPDNLSDKMLIIGVLVIYVACFFIIYRALKLLSSLLR